MPKIDNKRQKIEIIDFVPTGENRFVKLPHDAFHLIFQFYLRDWKAILAMSQTCKLAREYSRESLSLWHPEIRALNYRQLKFHYKTAQKWFPDKKIKYPVDVILLMPNLVKLSLTGLFSEEKNEAEVLKAFQGIFKPKFALAPKVESITIRNIELGDWRTTNQFIAYTRAMPKSLTSLRVFFKGAVSSTVVSHIGKRAPNLTFVKLPYVNDFNGVEGTIGFRDFTRSCTQLTSLDCSNFHLTQGHMQYLKNCKNLTHIKALRLVEFLPQNAPQLKSLDLRPGKKIKQVAITVFWLRQLFEHCKELEELHIGETRFERGVLEVIAELGGKLKVLDLSRQRDLFIDQLREIVISCENLKELYLDDCPPMVAADPIIARVLKR